MAQVIYVPCPECRREFYVGPEFFSIPDSYCHCPYCGAEFSVYKMPEDSRKPGVGVQKKRLRTGA
jgi:hypothetical protein